MNRREDQNAEQRREFWLAQPSLDEALREELLSVGDDKNEVEGRFGQYLEFGTGGLRGLLGAGTNRMNVHTVSKATRGLAAHLNKSFANPSCAVAYDSRINSALFAKTTASALATAGVKVYIFDSLRPTPMLSFAVRYLACSAGVMITASHNPASYNGYKVYGSDGGQITLEDASAIQSAIMSEPDFENERADFDFLLKTGGISYISKQTDDAFFDAVFCTSVKRPEIEIKVAYSPLNGAGNMPVKRILKRIGNVELFVVPEQEHPDGNFPTCPKPNPEVPQTMKLVSTLCEERGADVCFATDADSDRIGAGALNESGSVRLIGGNELGILLFDFVCKMRSENKTMPKRPVAVKTIVTSDMANAVAKKYGVELCETLTGFKYIGEQIKLLEDVGEKERFIFGFEESCGYLAGSYARDKDAVGAALLLCEMTAYYKQRGLSLLSAYEKLCGEYGCYSNTLLNFEFSGVDGKEKMSSVMSKLRAEYKGRSVDYLVDDTGLPKSDVLSVSFENGSRFIARPSGTEPKLKIYVSAHAETKEGCASIEKALCEACKANVDKL